jgi:hypothetical protein
MKSNKVKEKKKKEYKNAGADIRRILIYKL